MEIAKIAIAIANARRIVGTENAPASQFTIEEINQACSILDIALSDQDIEILKQLSQEGILFLISTKDLSNYQAAASVARLINRRDDLNIDHLVTDLKILIPEEIITWQSETRIGIPDTGEKLLLAKL